MNNQKPQPRQDGQAPRRTLGDVKAFIEWAQGLGCKRVQVGDIVLDFAPDASRFAEEMHKLGALEVGIDNARVTFPEHRTVIGGPAAATLADQVAQEVQDSRARVARQQRGVSEGAALEAIGRQRAEEERELGASGAPEFREPEDILEAEEAAESGERPPTAEEKKDPAVAGQE